MKMNFLFQKAILFTLQEWKKEAGGKELWTAKQGGFQVITYEK